MEPIERPDTRTDRTGPVLLTALIGLLLLAAVMSGCEDPPVGPEPKPPDETEMVTMQLVAEDSDGKTIAGAVFYEADTDTQLENPVEREKGSELDVRSEADGYQPRTKSVSFTSDGEAVFTLNQENPDEVTITFEIRDTHGTAVDGAELTSADTLVATGPNGSLTVPYSETVITFCGSANYYEQGCQDVQPTEDQSVTLTLVRETVEITITPEIVGYSDRIRDTDTWPNIALDNTEYRLEIGDSTWVDNIDMYDNSSYYIDSTYIGEGITTTYNYPTGPDPIQISMRAVYVPKEGHAYSDEHYLNVAEGSLQLPGDSDSETTLELTHIPACSDGVDNNFSGKADAEEPGCMDTWSSTSIQPGTDGFVYEPEDDYESLSGYTRTEGFYANSDYAVSGKEGQRESNFISFNTPLWELVEVAVSVEARFTKLVSKDQSGEEFALEFRTGSSENNKDVVNTTSIVTDEGKEGWIEVILPLSRDYFSEGTHYGMKIIHATKLREEDPTDGNDDVIIFQKQRDDYFVISAIYEPELLSQEIAKKQNRKKIGVVEITDKVVNLK